MNIQQRIEKGVFMEFSSIQRKFINFGRQKAITLAYSTKKPVFMICIRNNGQIFIFIYKEKSKKGLKEAFNAFADRAELGCAYPDFILFRTRFKLTPKFSLKGDA